MRVSVRAYSSSAALLAAVVRAPEYRGCEGSGMLEIRNVKRSRVVSNGRMRMSDPTTSTKLCVKLTTTVKSWSMCGGDGWN
jgi:hypothetical protein